MQKNKICWVLLAFSTHTCCESKEITELDPISDSVMHILRPNLLPKISHGNFVKTKAGLQTPAAVAGFHLYRQEVGACINSSCERERNNSAELFGISHNQNAMEC